jgi:hypothetical protein
MEMKCPEFIVVEVQVMKLFSMYIYHLTLDILDQTGKFTDKATYHVSGIVIFNVWHDSMHISVSVLLIKL